MKYDATEATAQVTELDTGAAMGAAMPAATPQVPDTAAASVAPTDSEQKRVDQVDAKLANLIKAGVLVVDGEDYFITISLSDGQLLVNNHPFSADMLKF